MAENDIKQAIVARMQSHGLGGLVGASNSRRFFSIAAPPNTELPWVSFQRLGGTGVYGGGTNKRAPSTSFQFRVAAASTASLEAVQQQVLACFDGQTGTQAGVKLDKAMVIVDGIDDYDPGSKTYWTTMIFDFGWVVA